MINLSVPMFSRHKRDASPCYGDGNGCTERVVGCHSKCDKYKEWRTRELKRKDEAFNNYKAEKEARDYTINSIINLKNGRKRQRRRVKC